MNARHFASAWIGYIVVTFAAGFVWHLVLFHDTYIELGIFSRIEDPVIPLGLSAMFIQGGILAFLYPRFRGTAAWPVEGLRFGLIAGLFMATSAVLAEAGKNYVASYGTWFVLEGVYYLVQFALSGLVIAFVYRRHGLAG